MERDILNSHREFLKGVLSNIQGVTRRYHPGKNDNERKNAKDTLSDACRTVKSYMEDNPDFRPLLAKISSNDLSYFDYPDIFHVEDDTQYFIDLLEFELSKL